MSNPALTKVIENHVRLIWAQNEKSRNLILTLTLIFLGAFDKNVTSLFLIVDYQL